MSEPKTTCCKFAASIGPDKLEALNAELRTPNHRSFRKLAPDFGSKSAIERHKKVCLGLGNGTKTVTTFAVPDLTGLPEVRTVPGTLEPSTGTVETVGGAITDRGSDNSRARAPVSAKHSEERRNRVLEILSSMTAGTWDTPRDNVSLRIREWGLSRATVEGMAREAAAAATVDPESVEVRRAVALGRWGWGVEQARQAIENGPEGFDTMSKLLAAYAQLQTGWDKAAGVLDESPKIQISTNPLFVAVVRSLFASIAAYPEALAAARAAYEAQLGALRQKPSALSEGVITVEASEEAA